MILVIWRVFILFLQKEPHPWKHWSKGNFFSVILSLLYIELCLMIISSGTWLICFIKPSEKDFTVDATGCFFHNVSSLYLLFWCLKYHYICEKKVTTCIVDNYSYETYIKDSFVHKKNQEKTSTAYAYKQKYYLRHICLLFSYHL